jgi:hypothetical protein
MRYVYQAAALLFLTGLIAQQLPAQIYPANLSVTNFQLLNELRLNRTQSQYTYRADLHNVGLAEPSLTATAVSTVSSIQVVTGLGNLHFPPVIMGGTVTSSNTFVVIVDRTGNTDLGTLKWSFNAPVANAGPNQTVAIGMTANLSAAGTTNPSGIGTLIYSWVFTSRPPGTSAVLQNASSISPFFVPDVKGDYIIKLTVDNGAGTDTSSVTVSTVSTKPVANAGPDQTVKTGSLVQLTGAASHDADGNPLTYAWTLILRPARSSAVLNGANTVSPSFTADADGSYIAQLIVTDMNGSSDPATVSITTQNTIPVANAGPNQVVPSGSTVQLNGSGSTDVDGDPLTYRWTLTTVPLGSAATLSNSAAVMPTFVADQDGTYVAQLIVNDGHSDSVPSTVSISTNAVQPPVANPGADQSLIHGSVVTLNGSGTDPQGRPLTFQWALISRPPGSTATLSSLVISNPFFVADFPGTYVAQLVVNNGVLSSAPKTVTISSTNTAPVANAGPAQTIPTGTIVTLNGGGSSDAEGDTLTYAWSLLSVPAGSTASLLSPATVSPTFVADAAGQYIVQLIVNDGFVSSAPSTVTITAGVSGALSLSPSPLTLPNAPASLTVTLPTPAGSLGQVVKFVALDPTLISVPPSATVAPNSTSVQVTVTPLALGSTLLLASSAGFQPATVTVNVTSPSISVSLSSNVVGISKSVTGTVTLSGPAPAAGIDVNLAVDQVGIVNLPLTAHVNGGATTGTFSVTGTTAGSVNITASFPGFGSGNAMLTVSPSGAISIQQGLAVGVGQAMTLRVSLISPAPVGGVTVSLVSSDTNRLTVTPSITFSQGATLPDVPAQVAGVAFGSANVTASAPGFAGDTQSVQVSVNLSFNPPVLTISPGASQNITLALSGNAPPGGVLVTLSSDNAAVTVQGSITIPGGSASVQVPINAVSVGSAKISASSASPGVAGGSATVNVVPGVVITNASLPMGVVGVGYSVTLNATGGTSPYTFSATNLPAGLTLSNGVISGNPSASGTSTVAITATDSSVPTPLTTTVSLPLTINAALGITTASLPGGAVGSAYNASVVATGGITPYTFSATGLPVGITMSPAGVFSGTPLSQGLSIVVVTVTDSLNPTHSTATATFTINVSAMLTVTTASLPPGTAGAAYDFTAAAAGGNSPYSFSATGLPAGLSMDATGRITGTPSAAGTSSVTITVQDSSNPAHLTATATLPLTINPPALSITTVSLPNGAVGIAYNASVMATGGTPPYTFSATGLPAGLTMNAAGAISGTPSTMGPSTAVVTVTDSTLPVHMAATASLGLAVNPPVLAVSTTSLPGGTAGTAYTTAVMAIGGVPPYTFSATGLPAGLSMSAGGQITGTPTTAGVSTVAVTVTDQAAPTHATATASLTLTIVPPPLSVATSSLPSGTVSTLYNATVTAAGGTPPYTFGATGLPAGLSMNAAGAISGTPSATGTSTAVITVTDSTSPTHMTATASLAITINPPVLAISTASLPGGAATVAYNAGVAATGGVPPYSFSATGLPVGLNMGSDGQITGTPAFAGTSTVVVTVTDQALPAHATATASLTLTIAPPPLTITTSSLSPGVVGTGYNASVAATGGTLPYTFSATGLPAGLTMSAAGAITGTPTANGTSTAVITVTDSTNPTHMTATASLSITITAPPIVLNTSLLPGGTVGLSYGTSASASGGTPPYTFSATGLPAGLTITPGGAIGGTPTTAGTSSVLLTVTDSTLPTHQTASKTLPLVVAPAPLIISSSVLNDGVQFSPYIGGLSASGGTPPYHWVQTSGTLPNGLTLNPATGALSGIPTISVSSTPLGFQVTDSGVPAQMASAATTLTIAPSGVQPSVTVGGGTVGNNLQLQVVVSLTQASASSTQVTISSSNPSLVTLAGRSTDVGTGSISIQLPAGATTFGVYAQGLQSAGSVTLTASAGGFLSGTSVITLAPSGFVVFGPNGVGASVTVNQGSVTSLSVSAAQLDSSGHYVQIQQLRGPASAMVTLSSSSSSIAAVAPASLTFTGGIDTLPAQVTAGSTAGSTVVMASVPTGFTTPALNANIIPFTVQVASIVPANVSVGKNLETNANVTLQGTAPADLSVTIVSNDSTKLLLAKNPADAGSSSIILTIKAGHSLTPDFYVIGLDSTGSATYNASANGFGNANGTVTLNPSGFVLSGPFGLGQDFFTTTGSGPSSIDVASAMLDGGGNVVAAQAVAGSTVTVTLSSTNSVVGSITPSVMIIPGTGDATAQFTPLTGGSTTLKANPPAGFSAAPAGSINASVITPKIIIDSGNTIGSGLEQPGNIFLGAPAPAGGVQVTLTSDTPGAMNFSASATAAGSAVLVVTIPAGSSSAQYYMQALTSSGVVGVTATAAGYQNGTGSETLAPSGFIIGGPFGPGFPMTSHVGTPDTVTVSPAVLDSLGNVQFTQQLAGGPGLSVTLTNSNPSVGTIPLSVPISGGASSGSVQFTPLATGSTAITVVQPAPFSTPNVLDTTLSVTVQ